MLCGMMLCAKFRVFKYKLNLYLSSRSSLARRRFRE